LYLIMIIYLLFTLIPVIITIIVSVSTTLDLRLHQLPMDPMKGLIMNYSSVMFALSIDEPAFATAFINSMILGIGTGTLGLTVSLTAGYALARFKFRGNKFTTFLILSTQMFPGLILLIPQYVIWTNLNLLEPEVLIFGVLLAYVSGAVAYCTWMMKGYFETIPLDLEEAAMIDGASQLGTFYKIAIPLSKAGMVAVLIFTFLTAWSEFVLARTFIGETNPQATLPLLFYNYQNPAAPDNPIFFELLAPYALLVALPMIILFMLLQKQLAEGAVAGGIK
ncbi:MAG: carbohydrate ABC transporter permease, partial [Candidatus Hodarchaeales archaeon]